ncbi:MAG: peptidyl-prolyl cis-trans isomerase [Gammaproteobacteria bacterium]|nr:peptidyl-prolyl cis-trans isomerase [Gammaproteobacteria bacterium]
MLQNIGDKLKSQRWLALLILGPLALIFAVWGAYGIASLDFVGQSYGLKVNGESVPIATLQQAWQQKQSDYAAQLRTEIPEAKKSELQHELVEDYVRSMVLNQTAQARGYRVGDSELRAAIQGEPVFQVDGKFDPAAYRGMLAQIGTSAPAFEAQQRRSMQVGHLSHGLQVSDFMTPGEIKRAIALENEQREVRYLVVPVALHATAAVDEAAIKAWYDAHIADYQTPESVRLQYAELRLDAVLQEVAADAAGLQAFYQANQDRYTEEEKRRARHILIKVPDAAGDAAALKTAQELRAQIIAGKDFAELARTRSDDPGSRAAGGELGFANRSAYVKPFADALYALKPGEISQPVRTQFGYHLIQLEEVKPGQKKTLDSARAEIEADYRRQRASELYGDRLEQLQQGIEDGSVRDIAALAARFHMSTGEVPAFTRSGAAPLGGSAELVSAVFSDESLSGGRLVGPVALGQDRLVVLKVLEYHPAAARPLASVRADVVAAVRHDAGSRAARSAVDAALARLKGGATFDEVAKSLGVRATAPLSIGRGDPQLPVQLRDAAFQAPPPAGKPVYLALSFDGGNAALLAVQAVHAGAAGSNPKADEQLVARIALRQRDAEFQAYVQELQRRAKVRRNDTIFN